MVTKMRDGIVKRGGTWSYKLELPRDAATGRRRQQWVGGFRTRKEAEAERDDARAALRQGRRIAPSKQTVGEYLSEWLAGMRAEYAPGTWDATALHVNTYIAPRIGSVRLADLTTPILKALYADLRESGRVRGGGGLSAKTVHNVHRTISRALGDAVAETPPRIPANPAARAHKLPASPVQQTWTADQLHSFYRAVEDDRLFALWRLAGTTGLRRGELAGLRWSDVDLDAGVVAVASQRAKGGGAVHARRPKGRRGRSVSLDPTTVTALRAHRTAQLEDRMMLGAGWQDSGLVFTHADGSPLHPDSITKRLERIVRVAGLPWIKLHGMRHTHATLALEAGVPIKVVQERLGHSSIAITGDVYSHVTPGMQAEAAARVAAIVDGSS